MVRRTNFALRIRNKETGSHPPLLGVDYIFTELRIAINDARELCNVEPALLLN